MDLTSLLGGLGGMGGGGGGGGKVQSSSTAETVIGAQSVNQRTEVAVQWIVGGAVAIVLVFGLMFIAVTTKRRR